jgi:TolB-like protein
MGDRLDSWKDIAAYLSREVRTVQRWSSSRRLPVHRLPGGAKPRVFALKSEIDGWLQIGRHESAAQTPSVAVLPFANLGGKENDHFGEGLADDIINALTRIRGLRVTARTSSFAFRGKEGDVRKIGTQLGAATLLEGSIRREGERVRVSAQLVSATDGYHLWSESYDRLLTDIFAIQDEIAQAIALALTPQLAPGTVARRPTENLEAYDLWLRGRCVGGRYTPDGFARARECYAAAIALDPNFALPYASTAESLFHAAAFGMTASPEAAWQARDAALKALELNDSLGDAHALLGMIRGVMEYDWASANCCFQRALELSPGSAAVLMRHAWYCLVPQMRLERAIEEASQAAALDTLSPWMHSVFGLVLTVARDYRRAEEECRIAVELAPGLWFTHWFLGTALLLQGKLSKGFTHCRQVYERFPREPLVVGGMSAVYGLFSRRNRARALLSELLDLARTAYVPPLAIAWAYLGLEDDRVFEWLDRAIEARDPAVTHMPSMPIYDGIRRDARFQALLAKMMLAPGEDGTSAAPV